MVWLAWEDCGGDVQRHRQRLARARPPAATEVPCCGECLLTDWALQSPQQACGGVCKSPTAGRAPTCEAAWKGRPLQPTKATGSGPPSSQCCAQLVRLEVPRVCWLGGGDRVKEQFRFLTEQCPMGHQAAQPRLRWAVVCHQPLLRPARSEPTVNSSYLCHGQSVVFPTNSFIVA